MDNRRIQQVKKVEKKLRGFFPACDKHDNVETTSCSVCATHDAMELLYEYAERLDEMEAVWSRIAKACDRFDNVWTKIYCGEDFNRMSEK